jgi:hypothetical protein
VLEGAKVVEQLGHARSAVKVDCVARSKLVRALIAILPLMGVAPAITAP